VLSSPFDRPERRTDQRFPWSEPKRSFHNGLKLGSWRLLTARTGSEWVAVRNPTRIRRRIA
jgi:hypothetical protein